MYSNLKILLVETKDWNRNDIPIFEKLYGCFKELIVEDMLPYKSKLPPTRLLAKDLQVSRSTIVKTFDLLSFERFITPKKGSGYFVSYQALTQNISEEKKEKLKYPKVSKRAKLFEKYRYINTDTFSKKNIAFRPGLPPLDIFPVNKWKQLSNLHWREATPTSLSYAPSEGLESLRISIMNYLRVYRNIMCDYNQIIITSGSLHSIYLLGNALLNKDDEIVMENPTFPRAYNLFNSIRAKIIPCSIDREGIMINSIKEHYPKLIYTTPSNQYPLGVKMSKQRRLELINWVNNHNSLVIEDDYDHEFSNWSTPLPPLFSLDTENRVIYLGTFNKLLHPSLRVGYMVVPKYLVSPIKSIYEQSSRFVSVHTQETLNSFIVKDYLNKHIRKVIKVANERKNSFTNQTKNFFKIDTKFDGLHLIGKLSSNIDDVKVYKELLKNDVVAYPLSNYYITKEKQNGLVMGYSSVNDKVMYEKINQMNLVFNF